jgi:hypothetical protein
MSTTVKTCFKCQRELPVAEFYRHPQMADRHLGKCKQCTRTDVQDNYRKRREQYAHYERKRFQDPERRAAIQHYARISRGRDPMKYQARNATNNAIRDGKLIRKPCEVCGAKAQAHHIDYSRPLDVRWLCHAHHLAEHGKQAISFARNDI